MDPVQQIKAMLAMEAEGLELIAIYHSHPDGPARPSPTDVALAYYPDTVQLIISLSDRARPSVRGFTIVDGVVAEVGWELDDVAGEQGVSATIRPE
jgi:proteasome lid subunit RPN8/RPN11